MSSAETSTREKILSAACALLEGESAEAVTMARIARAAGISRQAVYLHFRTRAELLVAVARWLDLENDVDSRLAESRGAETGEARLKAFVAAWTAYVPLIHAAAAALRAAQETDAAAREAWTDRLQAIRHGCLGATQALARDGRLAAHLDAEAAADLLSALLSIETWERLVQDRGWTQATYEAEMQRLAHAAAVA